MSLRVRTLLTLGVAFVVAAAALAVLLYARVLPEFAEFEHELEALRVQRVMDLLKRDVDGLVTLCDDWAAWDDTYRFIVDHNAAYIKSNLPDGIAGTLDLSLMAFFDQRGDLVWGTTHDRVQELEAAPLPALLAALRQRGVLSPRLSPNQHRKGILRLPEGMAAVVVAPVITTTSEGPVRGHVVFGRALDRHELAELAKVAGCDVRLLPVESTEPAELAGLRQELAAGEPVVVPLDHNHVAGYGLLTDLLGARSLVVRTLADRPVHQRAQATRTYLCGAVLAVLLGLGCLTLGLVSRLVVAPVASLCRQVARIGASHDPEAWVTIAADRELAQLADGINAMLAELRAAEEQRRRLEEHLRHGERLESLGVLAGGIAHDFNNLLVAMMGNASLIPLVPGLPDEAAEYAREIETAAARAAELTSQMLAYAGKGQATIRPLDVSAVTRETAQLLHSVITKKARLRLACPAGLPAVEGDASQLRQVVMNLVTNASDALGAGDGEIHVTTGTVTKREGEVWPDSLPAEPSAGEHVFIEVRDTGCGMDEATRSRIFDPFFTTKFTGRGLGLAAVLGIARSHRGAVQVVSAPGAGTTVRLLLRASGAPSAAEPSPSPEVAAWSGAGTVLVVDDERAAREVIVQVLRSCGLDVIEAADGVEALEVMAARGAEVDLIVLDATMPRMDGAEALEALRPRFPDLPVLVCSGYHEQHVVGRFEGLGLHGFVHKPFRAADLIAMVHDALTGGQPRQSTITPR